MKIATCNYRNQLHACRIEDGHAIIPDSESSVLDLLDGGADALNAFREAAGERINLGSLTPVVHL